MEVAREHNASARRTLADVVDGQPLRGIRMRVYFLLILVMLFDGYDLQANSYAAPALIDQWHIAKASFGVVFGAGLGGMMLGAILLSWFGDQRGRKTAIVLGTAIYSIFNLLTIFAADLPTLVVLRFCAGIGIGGVFPNAIALNTEFTPRSRQTFWAVAMFTGYTLGSMSGGILAALLVPIYGWKIIYLVGGVPSLFVAGVVMLLLPESPFFRLRRGRPTDLVQVRRVIRRMGVDEDEVKRLCSERVDRSRAAMPVTRLFVDGRAKSTLLLWATSAFNLMCMQFLGSWMPTILRSDAVSQQQAAIITACYQAGGVIGGLVIGRAVDRFALFAVTTALLLASLCITIVGRTDLPAVALITMMFFVGSGTAGSQASLNAASGTLYPSEMRATGAGWAVAVARIGSISGPVIGGILIGAGFGNSELFGFAAIPILIAAAASFGLATVTRKRRRSTELATAGVTRET